MAKSIVEKYEQILAADPGSMVFVELAKALIDRGENGRAIDVCEKGLGHHPDSIVGRVLWGKALLNVGKPDLAMAQFDQAIGIDRENPYAYNLIGEVLLHKGLYRSALPILKKAVLLQPGDLRVRQWLEQVQRQLGEAPNPGVPPDQTRVDPGGTVGRNGSGPVASGRSIGEADATIVDRHVQGGELPREDAHLEGGVVPGLTATFEALAGAPPVPPPAPRPFNVRTSPDLPFARDESGVSIPRPPDDKSSPFIPLSHTSPVIPIGDAAEEGSAEAAAAPTPVGEPIVPPPTPPFEPAPPETPPIAGEAPVAVADRSTDHDDERTEPAGQSPLALGVVGRVALERKLSTDPSIRLTEGQRKALSESGPQKALSDSGPLKAVADAGSPAKAPSGPLKALQDSGPLRMLSGPMTDPGVGGPAPADAPFSTSTTDPNVTIPPEVAAAVSQMPLASPVPRPEGSGPKPVPQPPPRPEGSGPKVIPAAANGDGPPSGPPRPPPLKKEITNPRIVPPPLRKETTNPKIMPGGKREVTDARFALAMIPDAAPPEHQPAVIVQNAPDAAEAARIAEQYEQELRERLLSKKDKPATFLRSHWLALSVVSALVLVGGGGAATYWAVKRAHRAEDVRKDVDDARRGLARETEGALRAALGRLEEARDNDPKNADAAALSAQVNAVLWADYRDPKAKAAALELAQGKLAPEVALVVSFLLADGDAAKPFAEALAALPAPASPLALDLAGRAQLAKGDATGALKNLEAAAKSVPPFLRALNDLGDYYKGEAAWEQALGYYSAAKAAHATNPRASIGLAEVAIATGRGVKEALDGMRAVEKDAPSAPGPADKLRFEIAYAKLLAASNDRPAAVDRLEKATAELAGRPEVPAALAEVYALSGAHDRAEAEAERAVKLAPKETAYRVLLAKALLARSKYKDVIARTDGVENRQIHLLRGVARYESGDFEKARQEFEATRRNQSMLADAVAYLALTELALKRPDAAKKLVEALLASKNPHALAYVAKGRLEWEDGKGPAAEESFREATNRDSTNVEAFCALGRAQLKAGKIDDAKVALTRAATLNPYHAEARLALAQAYLAAADPQAAKKELLDIVKEREKPDGETLRTLSAAFLAGKEPAEARRAAERAARADGRNPESWIAVGRAALAQGDQRPAALSLERARALAPRNDGVLATLGEVYLKMGNAPQARKAFEAAAKLEPRSVAYRVGMGRAALLARDFKGAQKDLEAAKEIADKSTDKAVMARLHASLARSLLAQKAEPGKATAEAKSAVKADDGVAEAHFALGKTLEEKSAPEARKEFERAVTLDPGAPDYRLALGTLLAKDGADPARAAVELQEYLRLAPKGADAAQAKKLLADARKKSR